jgi:hypothetical protein
MSFNVHVSKGDSMETLLKDLKEKFPNSGEAEKIDEYNLEIDLGDGYCLTMGSLEEFGGDKGSWSVAIKKE